MGRGGRAGRRGVTDTMMINSDCSLGTQKTYSLSPLKHAASSHRLYCRHLRTHKRCSPPALTGDAGQPVRNTWNQGRARTSCCHCSVQGLLSDVAFFCRAGDTEGRSAFTVGQRGNAAAALHSVDKVSSVLWPDQGEESQVCLVQAPHLSCME